MHTTASKKNYCKIPFAANLDQKIQSLLPNVFLGASRALTVRRAARGCRTHVPTRDFVLARPHLRLVSLGRPVNGLHGFAPPLLADLGEAGLAALGAGGLLGLVNAWVPALNGREG